MGEQVLTPVAFDTETHLIKFTRREGKSMGTRMLAPRLVCGSWAEGNAAGLVDRQGALLLLRRLLLDRTKLLVGHNVSYDLGVCCAEDPSMMRLVFEALLGGRVADTMLREKLICIAQGLVTVNGKEFVTTPDGLKPAAFHLAELSERYLGAHLEKENTWRLRYRELDGVPLEEWPEEAKNYPIKDATTTLQVYTKQNEFAGAIPNEAEQVRAAFALHLISMWGLRSDPEAVRQLRENLEMEQEETRRMLVLSGLIREDGSKDTKKIRARIEQELGEEATRTEKGAVQMTEEQMLATGHPDLVLLAKSLSGAKILSTYVPILEARADGPVGCRYDSLKATGRTSSSSPNDQNPPRKGGVRECYVPRPGCVFVSADYDTLELRAWAQACLDLVHESQMAEALRRGEDLHLSLAALIMGVSVGDAVQAYKQGSKEVEDWRQQCKIANFGFPGGMSARTFVEYCGAQGFVMTEEKARQLHEAWKERWPEHKAYFNHVQATLGATGEGTIEQLRSGRIRGGLSFCEAANSYFQGLAADGAKEALFRVQAECYANPTKTPLYGCRPVVFMHDEIIMEVPTDRADAAAARLAQVMIEGMSKYIVDVPVTATPVAMRRWYKGAKPVRVDGVLVPSKPVHEDVNGKQVTKWIADI